MRSLNVRQNVLGVLPASDTIYNLVLAAGVAENVTPPAGARFVVINSTGGKLFVKAGVPAQSDAAIPGADVTDGTGQMIDPVILDLTGVTEISMISEAANIVSLAFYAAE